MTSWFRSWHGAPTDNKWLVIAKRANVAPGIVSAVAWALFDHASQADDRGSVEGFDTETYALWAGWCEADVIAVVDAMRAKGVIDADDRLHAWDKRQPKREDDSAERVREFRKRQNAAKQDVTQCNAEKRTETNVTHGNNTEPDTDTEKKTTTSVVVVSGDSATRYKHVCDLITGNGFGMMTSLMAEQVHGMIDEYPDDWIDHAFEVAVKANKRRLDYVLGTLENIRRDGMNGKPKGGGNGSGYIRDSDRHVPNAWQVLMQQSSEAQQ